MDQLINFLIGARDFIIVLSVLVFVHELGHFLAARLCKMRVERFSIGLPPRAFGKVIGDTDYCVSWLPFGGYVKIAGMIDESFDTKQMSEEPKPDEYRARPVYQRMFVISAGVIMNILLALVIFFWVTYTEDQVIYETTEIAYVLPGSPEEEIGFQAGDRVLRINGETISDWNELTNYLYFTSFTSDLTITLLRKGEEVDLFVNRVSFSEEDFSAIGVSPAHMQVIIRQVDSGKPAHALGLQADDILVSLNDSPVRASNQVSTIVQSSGDHEIHFQWERGGEIFEGTVAPDNTGMIGIVMSERYTGPHQVFTYSFFEAIPVSMTRFGNVSISFLNQLWLMFTGETSVRENIGGPIKIAQLATQSAERGLTTYLMFMAILSLSLAVINMFPIPGLDGGHFVMLIYEGVFRREIPTYYKLKIQQVGVTLLLALMAFVIYNDIISF